MKRLMACLVLLIGLVCLAPVRDAEASNWVWVTSTDFATISIDAASARRYNGAVYYWEKWEFIDSTERNAYIEKETRLHRKFGDYQTDYSDFWTMKTHKHAYRARNGAIYVQILESVDYDSHGNVIYSSSGTESTSLWQTLSPDTVGEAAYEVASSYAR